MALHQQGAHWDAPGDSVGISADPKPAKSPVGYVHPSKYIDYELVPDLATSEKCLRMLQSAGFNASK